MTPGHNHPDQIVGRAKLTGPRGERLRPVARRKIDEYLRRNLNVARAVGAMSLADSILKRLGEMKNPPRWLIEKVRGIQERVGPLPRELAAYRGKPPEQKWPKP